MWGDQFAYDSAAVHRREREKQKRERVTELASIQLEEDECFRLIRSRNERERLEGYRQHLPLLGRKHEITIQYDDSSRAYAEARRRRIRYAPH